MDSDELTRLADLSRSADQRELGRRLRAARIAAGLTQAEVAGHEVTGAYVSRIEDGQRRPEFGLLQRMAQRMNTTAGVILDGLGGPASQSFEVELNTAELELAGGHAERALIAVEDLLGRLPSQSDYDETRFGAINLRAGALEAVGRPDEAIAILEDLVRSTMPSAKWVQVLIALSRCLRQTGQLDRAIAAGEDAMELIERYDLRGLPEATQLSVTVSAALMLRGDLEAAMRRCTEAIDAAEHVQSPLARASAYGNASTIQARNGSNAAALALARKALTYSEIADDLHNRGKLRVQVAAMQLKAEPADPGAALETLERAERELSSSSSSMIDLADRTLTRARAQFMLGDLEAAQDSVAATLATVPRDAQFTHAAALALGGQVHLAAGRQDEARAAFQLAAQTLTGVGADREAAQLWFDLGTMLAHVGEVQPAMDALRRAAASTGLQESAPATVTSAES